MLSLELINAEIADLERKLQALRGVAAAYRGDGVSPSPSVPALRTKPPSARGKRAEILDAAGLLIEAGNGVPVSISSLWQRLRDDGVIEADYKPNALSALISGSKRYDPNGREGWTPKRPSSEMISASAGGWTSHFAPPADVLPAGRPADGVSPEREAPEGPGGGT